MTRSARTSWTFILSFVSTLAVGMGALVLIVGPAQAAAPASCLNTEEGAISGKQVDSYSWTSRGTRADVRVVGNSDVVCQHISSLFVWNGNGGAEFGYVIGYSNCAGYTGTFRSNAKPFIYVRTASGTQHGCKVFTGRNLPQQTYQSMRISDKNADYRWGPWLNGEELLPGSQGYVLDFNQGMNGFGMERGNPPDPGYSRNNNLEEYHDGNGWSPWDDLRKNSASDPDYKFKEWNTTTGGSVAK
jgi:hypothetical protein